MAPPDPEKARRGLLRMLSARVEHVSASIGHRVTQGLANEEALRELLRDSLPSHVGVGDGVIVGAQGEASRQADVVLYDRRRGNPMISPLTKIYFADQTYAVVEVKTTYTKSALSDALANVQSVKRLSVANESWTEWVADGDGGQALVNYEPRPPLGVVIFLGADLPSGPVDLANHFEGMRDEIAAIPLGEQPDLIVSVAHATTFRHVDIGAHSASTQQFTVTLLQDPETQQPMSVDADLSTGAVVEVGEPALGFGQQDAVEVTNLSGTRRVLVVRPSSFAGDATVHKLAAAGGELHILDPGRALLLALASLEQLVRLRKLNPNWGLHHYFGSSYGMSSVYPDDLHGGQT